MVSLPWCSSNADAPWHIPFSLSGRSLWMRALYRISVRKPIDYITPIQRKESSHYEELSSSRTYLSTGQNLGKGYPQTTRQLLWWAWFVKREPTRLSKNEIMLEPTFGPFQPYHSPPGAWKLRRCTVSRLCKGIWQAKSVSPWENLNP